MTLPYDPDQVPTGARRALVDRVGAGAEVLDIGCWSGFVGRYLRASREAVVDGIEPHPGMAELARASYRTVVASTVEAALAGDALADRRYDAVLALDVLEHLADPLPVLSEVAGRLAEGGRVLASVPNVAHWSLRKELLRGRWDYQDSGLMDRTHLRFFTRRTLEELFTAAGLTVVAEDAELGHLPRLRLTPRREAWMRRRPELFAVQFLVVAERTP